jgi:5-methyltetrahydropteroyltriglutamate--homocysteine methyltransferase
MTETYRAGHIGSLSRPPELLRARTAHDQGRIGPDELRQIEDRSIVDILTMQRDRSRRCQRRRVPPCRLDGRILGIRRRLRAAPGYENDHRPRRPQYYANDAYGGGREAAPRAPRVARGIVFSHGVRRNPLQDHRVKPGGLYDEGVTDKVYPTRAALAHDLAPIIRGELLELVEEGVPYIQIDAPQYTQLADPVPSGAGEAGRLGSGLGHR